MEAKRCMLKNHVGPEHAEGEIPSSPTGALGKVGNSTGSRVNRDCVEQEDEAEHREGRPVVKEGPYRVGDCECRHSSESRPE